MESKKIVKLFFDLENSLSVMRFADNCGMNQIRDAEEILKKAVELEILFSPRKDEFELSEISRIIYESGGPEKLDQHLKEFQGWLTKYFRTLKLRFGNEILRKNVFSSIQSPLLLLLLSTSSHNLTIII